MVYKEVDVPADGEGHEDFWVYNLTNKDDVLTKGAAPELVELGPYTWSTNWTTRLRTFSSDGTEFSEERASELRARLAARTPRAPKMHTAGSSLSLSASSPPPPRPPSPLSARL